MQPSFLTFITILSAFIAQNIEAAPVPVVQQAIQAAKGQLPSAILDLGKNMVDGKLSTLTPSSPQLRISLRPPFDLHSTGNQLKNIVAANAGLVQGAADRRKLLNEVSRPFTPSSIQAHFSAPARHLKSAVSTPSLGLGILNRINGLGAAANAREGASRRRAAIEELERKLQEKATKAPR